MNDVIDMNEYVHVLEMLLRFFVAVWHVVLLVSPLVIIYLLRKGCQAQRAILAALEASAKSNAATLAVLRGIARAPQAQGPEAEDDEAAAAPGDDTPADFVYCPECSTRVEVDPSVRNINVVCPDCKKPFHIH